MFCLGIDLGGTGIKTGVVDEQYNIIGRGSAETRMPRHADLIMDDIARAAFAAVEDAGLTMDDISYVGVGTPGAINQATGILEFAGNLDINKYPLRRELENRLNKSICIENDANAAAFGEYIAGAAKGCGDVVCITLGTGVGSGIIIDGRVYNGCNYTAGEFGHTVIVADGIECNCGRQGCYEKYASVSALIEQTKESMREHPESSMWQIVQGDISKVNGKTSFDAMRAGDSTAAEVVDRYIKYIACGVINAVNIFQPDVICIGGGISKEKDTLLNPLRALVFDERFSKNSERQTRLVVAKLGNDAGIIGAAFLHRNKVQGDA